MSDDLPAHAANVSSCTRRCVIIELKKEKSPSLRARSRASL
jgi:hypothetical protein